MVRGLCLLVMFALASCGPPTPQAEAPQNAKSPTPVNWKLPATGVLTLTDLSNFAKLERDFVKVDDFSKNFDDSPLEGRQFAVELDAPNYGGSSVTMIHWTYDADQGVLTINIDPSSTIQSTTEFGPKKKMSNAFGAEIEADTMESWEIALGSEYDKPIGVFPVSDSPYSFGAEHGFLTHEMRLPPEQARQLTQALRLRLEGEVVGDSTSGQTVYCGTDTNSATLTHPTESTIHKCTINVRYSRVVVLGPNGNVLKEWVDKPEVAAKPKADEVEAEATASEEGDGAPMHGPYSDVASLVDDEGDPVENNENEDQMYLDEVLNSAQDR